MGPPLADITIAQIFAMIAYGPLLGGTRRYKEVFSAGRKPVVFMVLTGVFLAMGRLFRWVALDMAPVTVVAPILGSVPLITVGFSYVILRGVEKITARLWLGVGLVVSGVVLVTLSYAGIF